jgi:hypothetical protein
MNTKKDKDLCTLWIRRSFGTDFTLYFNSPEEAWVSAMGLVKVIEDLENTESIIYTSWDVSSGKTLSKATYVDKPGLPVQTTKFWASYLNSIDYPIAQGNSFQLFLVKGHGLTNISFHKNAKTLLMSEAEASIFLNDNDEEITTVKTKNTVNVHRPVY